MQTTIYRTRVITLWILILLGVILHFNYHVSEMFYGVNLVKPGSNGQVPASAYIIKNIFYHLPMLFIVGYLYFEQRWFKLSLFIIGCIYTVSHAFHLAGEFKHETYDWGQIPLLTIVLLVSVLLNKTAWDYYKNAPTS